MPKPLRNVTAPRCAICHKRFTAKRKDARYCSDACRQRAARSRAKVDDLDRQIHNARVLYWTLISRKAEALDAPMSDVVTGEAQTVDGNGNVFMHGEHVGHTTPHRLGWETWGLEAAGPPWSPPPLAFDASPALRSLRPPWEPRPRGRQPS
jgi:hypothetical protein